MTNLNQKKKIQSERKDSLGTKIYVVRKYITANSAYDAILKDKSCPVDDVWLDEDSRKQIIGFNTNK